MTTPAAPENVYDDNRHDPADHLVLVVDDIPDNVTMLAAHLRAKGYRTLKAYSGVEAIKLALTEKPDLIMLDINMPQLSGLDVCSQLKQHPETAMTPIILVTAHSDTKDIVRGFEVGADDYLIKPYSFMEMLARVRSMLRITDAQARLLAANQALDELNSSLERKVREQVEELGRVNRLRRFFSPQIVDTIISDHGEDVLKEHRREITVVFLDLRNFTSFAEKASPQDVLQTVREFHAVVGPIIFEHRGTLERFTGDGLMVFLGDPEPMEDHPEQAVRMASQIRVAAHMLREERWKPLDTDLRLGIGVATGVASIGTIGFEGRLDYAALGTVTNLAARLCSMAKGGQVLLADTTVAKLGEGFATELCGEIRLKGFSEARRVFELL